MLGQDTAPSAGQPKSKQKKDEKSLKARTLVDLVGPERFHSQYDQEV